MKEVESGDEEEWGELRFISPGGPDALTLCKLATSRVMAFMKL